MSDKFSPEIKVVLFLPKKDGGGLGLASASKTIGC